MEDTSFKVGIRRNEDPGLDFYVPFKSFSTHPARSNSGTIRSGGLAAPVFNGALRGSVPRREPARHVFTACADDAVTLEPG